MNYGKVHNLMPLTFFVYLKQGLPLNVFPQTKASKLLTIPYGSKVISLKASPCRSANISGKGNDSEFHTHRTPNIVPNQYDLESGPKVILQAGLRASP